MSLSPRDPAFGDVDEVQIVDVEDGDPTPVNTLLRAGWHLLACGVAEQRLVRPSGEAVSVARCTFILGRNGAEQVLEEAVAIVEAIAPDLGEAERVPV